MPTSSIRTLAIALALLATTCACAGSSVEGSTRSNPNILTWEEMAEAPASNLLEVVAQLRPRWLQIRGQGQIIVYMNRSYLGGMEELRGYNPEDVLRIRYYDGTRAAAVLTGYPSTIQVAGAIVMETSMDEE